MTSMQKIRNFHVYRCLQVMNQIWLTLSKPLVGILLTTYSGIMILLLYVLISGGFTGISSLLNTFCILILVISVGVLFYAGIIFFQYMLAIPLKSRDCWLQFDKCGIFPSKFTRTFQKSCRPISMYFGLFFAAINPALSLIFFRFILEHTTELIITTR